MEITKEYLLNLRERAVAKRQEYVSMVQQADGAIAMVDHILGEMTKSESPQEGSDELRE
jgi:hypothetical protein